METKFKVGDKVKCINNYNFVEELDLGHVYTVKTVEINPLSYEPVIGLVGINTGLFYASRFELVSFNKNNNEPTKISSNLYKLKPDISQYHQMRIFYSSLESRGVSPILFNGYINGLNIEINNKHTKMVIEGGMSLGSLVEWQVFIENLNNDNKRPIFGAHNDFDDDGCIS